MKLTDELRHIADDLDDRDKAKDQKLERIRIILFDVVRMYSELELGKELLEARVKSGEQEIIILRTEVSDAEKT